MRLRTSYGSARRGEGWLRLALGVAIAAAITISTATALADASSGGRVSGRYVVIYRLARHSHTVRVTDPLDAVVWSVLPACRSGECGFSVKSRRQGVRGPLGRQQWHFAGDGYARDEQLGRLATGYDCRGVQSNRRLFKNDATSIVHAALKGTVVSKGGRVIRFDGAFIQRFTVTPLARRDGCHDGWEIWSFSGYAIR
jgi:hypothetical protein